MNPTIVLCAAVVLGGAYCAASRRVEGCNLWSGHSLCLLVLLATISLPAVIVGSQQLSSIPLSRDVEVAVVLLSFGALCATVALFIGAFAGVCCLTGKDPRLARPFGLVALFLFPCFLIAFISMQTVAREFIGG